MEEEIQSQREKMSPEASSLSRYITVSFIRLCRVAYISLSRIRVVSTAIGTLKYHGILPIGPIPQLPLEVVDIIARKLVDRGDLQTCARLNSASRQFFEATLPTLWKEQHFIVGKIGKHDFESDDWEMRKVTRGFRECRYVFITTSGTALRSVDFRVSSVAAVIMAVPHSQVRQIIFLQPSVVVGTARRTHPLGHIVFSQHARYDEQDVDYSLRGLAQLDPIHLHLHLPTCETTQLFQAIPRILTAPTTHSTLQSVRLSLDSITPAAINCHLPAVMMFGLGMLARSHDLVQSIIHTDSRGTDNALAQSPGRAIPNLRISATSWEAAALVVATYIEALGQDYRFAIITIDLRLSETAFSAIHNAQGHAGRLLEPLVSVFKDACAGIEQDARGGLIVSRRDRRLAEVDIATFKIVIEAPNDM